MKDEKVVQSSYGAEKVSHSRRPKDHSFFIRKSWGIPSIDDKKVVQSPCRRKKKGNDFFGENQPGIPGEKKYPRKKNPEGTQHTIGNKEQNKCKKRGLLIPGEKKYPRKKTP